MQKIYTLAQSAMGLMDPRFRNYVEPFGVAVYKDDGKYYSFAEANEPIEDDNPIFHDLVAAGGIIYAGSEDEAYLLAQHENFPPELDGICDTPTPKGTFDRKCLVAGQPIYSRFTQEEREALRAVWLARDHMALRSFVHQLLNLNP